MLRKLLLVITMMVAGCAPAPMVLVKDGAGQQEFGQDLARCEYESASATAGIQPGLGSDVLVTSFTRATEANRLKLLCMQANGWRQATRDEIERAGLKPPPEPETKRTAGAP